MARPNMGKFLLSLSADEASRVLAILLDKNPDLVKKAYDIAKQVASKVNPDDIMNDVFSELDSLDYDDLSGRSGRTRHGYVAAHDAAWELFEERLDPFIDEMKKNQKRGLPVAAKNYCIGIIKGLRYYEQESLSELADWLTDAPGEYIHTVVKEWKKGNPSDEDIAEIMSVVEGDYDD